MLVSAARITPFATAVCLAACGCASFSGPEEPAWLTPVPATVRRATITPPANTGVIPASYREDAPARQTSPLPPMSSSPLEGVTALTAENVVRIVLDRNPTLDQMRASAAVLV